MIHFQCILADIDPYPLLDQIVDHPELWNYDNSWTRGKAESAVYATENIVLRYNKSSVPGVYDWNKPAFSILTAAQPIALDLMRAVPGEHLGKVVISRLLPGQKIDWHIDRMPPGVMIYWQRYQIPLQVDPDVRFVVEDEELYMEPGTAWWFDNQRMHAVFNDSSEPRISMFVEIRPFTPLQV